MAYLRVNLPATGDFGIAISSRYWAANKEYRSRESGLCFRRAAND